MLAFTFSSIGYVLLIIFLLACSGLISASEVAFFSLTRAQIEELEQEKSATSNKIIKLIEEPRYLLATMLIANNFVNISITLVLASLLDILLPISVLENWATNLMLQVPFLQNYTSVSSLGANIKLFIDVVFATFLILSFGEIIPKVYARLESLKTSYLVAGILTFLRKIFYPLSYFLVNSTQAMERRLEKKVKLGTNRSMRDIDKAIELTVSHESDSAHEVDILKGIVKFNNTTVKQIMRARVDVETVDFRWNFKQLMDTLLEAGYSRYPVHEENYDNIVGILYVKDLHLYANENEDFEWQSLIKTNLFYVPESKKINDLLKEFQSRKIHLAMVVDEYGGISGVATLEDIMEEIIGEIRDEFDDDIELEYKKIDEQNYIFEGKTLLNDVCRVVGIDTSTFDDVKGDGDSLAGLMLEILGYIPKKDQEISFQTYTFKIIAVNKRRIERIQMILPRN